MKKLFYLFLLICLCTKVSPLKKIKLSILILMISSFSFANPVRVALITGPNGYNKESFIPMMNSLKGVTWKEYKTSAAHELFTVQHSDEYDVLMFYDPDSIITEVHKQDLMNLVSGGKSVMVVHYGMGTYNNWPEFARIVGSKYFLTPQILDGKEYGFSSYREGVDISVKVADKNHFITKGIKDFKINDEVYGNMWQSPKIHTLLTTDNPECSPSILYTYNYGKGKIVGLTLAHGKGAFSNKNYVRIFLRSLFWLADETKQEPVVLAYVTSWEHSIPDPHVVTHINYAFGHVNASFNGIRINNPERLKMIAGLKNQNPSLKVSLSIGGWGSGNFSEMAANNVFRRDFASDCRRVIDEYGLDGIDIDWEFPTSGAAGISSSSEDTENYTLMMRDIRQAIGNDKLLTLASQAWAGYINFAAIDQYIDFVNIMTYDMDSTPYHHAGLYRSDMMRHFSCEESVTNHVKAGIPIYRLVLGIPFYGHGRDDISNFIHYKKIIKLEGYKKKWDKIAKVPYLTDSLGKIVCNYENEKSIKIKCDFLLNRGMRGAMYWEYDGDDEEGTLRKAVYNGTMRIKN